MARKLISHSLWWSQNSTVQLLYPRSEAECGRRTYSQLVLPLASCHREINAWGGEAVLTSHSRLSARSTHRALSVAAMPGHDKNERMNNPCVRIHTHTHNQPSTRDLKDAHLTK